jgi:hypothetical protein
VESHKAEKEDKKHYDWYEFTPFEIGSDEYGGKSTFFLVIKNFDNFLPIYIFHLFFFFLAWIPSWAFGREFKSGKSVNRSPEQNISQLLG